jgi:hypothetical protein
VLEETRRLLAEQLGGVALESVMGVIGSRLDLSVAHLLATHR